MNQNCGKCAVSFSGCCCCCWSCSQIHRNVAHYDSFDRLMARLNVSNAIFAKWYGRCTMKYNMPTTISNAMWNMPNVALHTSTVAFRSLLSTHMRNSIRSMKHSIAWHISRASLGFLQFGTLKPHAHTHTHRVRPDTRTCRWITSIPIIFFLSFSFHSFSRFSYCK